MVRIVAALLATASSFCAAPALASAGREARFKIATPATLAAGDDQTLILRQREAVEAHAPTDGRLLWSTKIGALAAGARSVALCAGRVYALSATGLLVLDRAAGAIVGRHAFHRPSAVLCAKDGVLVSHAQGLTQLGPGAKRRADLVPTGGELLALDGQRAIVFRRLGKDTQRSPLRLTVVDLASNKTVYEFKLLRDGAHRLLRAEGGTLALLDYSTASAQKRKLYFTRADHRAKKKLSDVSLAKHYPNGPVEGFDGVALHDGGLLLASKGDEQAEHSALLYRPTGNAIVWKQRLPAGVEALARVGEVLWLSVRSPSGVLLALDLGDGHPRQRIVLDGPPRGPLIASGGSLYLTTGKSLWRMAPATSGPPAVAKKGWRLYRDALAGYTFALPTSWQLVAKRIQHYGKGRFSVPFVRYRQDGDRWSFLASIHVLVRPAAGQTVEQLATSVLEQWRRRMGHATPIDTQRFTRDGTPFLLASYRFRNRTRQHETSRSLCVVSHGFAFELRARTSAAGEGLWPEIVSALKGFRPRPELVGAKGRGAAPATPAPATQPHPR